MNSDYLEIKNKETLWNIMYENKFFNSKLNDIEIKSILETTMNTIENSNTNQNLLEKNKLTLLKIKNYLENKELITSEQIIKQRQDTLMYELDIKKNELNSILKKNIPEEIDFTDKEEDNNENLDILLKKTIKNREEQLNMTFDKNIINIDKNIKIENNNELLTKQHDEVVKLLKEILSLLKK